MYNISVVDVFARIWYSYTYKDCISDVNCPPPYTDHVTFSQGVTTNET